MTERVLILTPVKDAAGDAEEYVDRLLSLTYPRAALSVGLLESDSTDATFEAFTRQLPRLTDAGWRRAHIWQRHWPGSCRGPATSTSGSGREVWRFSFWCWPRWQTRIRTSDPTRCVCRSGF